MIDPDPLWMTSRPDAASLMRAAAIFVIGFACVGFVRMAIDGDRAGDLLLQGAVLAVTFALAVEPRLRGVAAAEGGAELAHPPAWRTLAVAAACAAAAALVVTADRGPVERGAPSATLAVRTARIGEPPLAALTIGLAALACPAAVLAARRASLRLPVQAAGGAVGFALPTLLCRWAFGPTWVAAAIGAIGACAMWLVDAREGRETLHRPLRDPGRGLDRWTAVGLATALSATLAAGQVGRLASSHRGAGAVVAMLDAAADAIGRHVASTGRPPASLADVAGLDSRVVLGLGDGYLYRYVRTSAGWWALAADPADPAEPGPFFRKVGAAPVEAGDEAFRLEPPE